MAASKEKRSRFIEIFTYFLRLGFLGFGGPLALMASFQKELIEKRGWIPAQRFAQALSLIKAMPGPTATQLAIYLGQVRAGRLGGLIAGVCLIFPAFLMMLLLGAFYQTAAELSWSKPLLFGMQAAALGVIADSLWRLAKPYKGRLEFWTVALVAATCTYLKPSAEPLIILGSGVLGALTVKGLRIPGLKRIKNANALVLGISLTSAVAVSSIYGELAKVFIKAGAFVFGSGLAIVPILANDVVDKMHWLNHQEFMDALAFGQITPGPVVITSTFIGYRVAGILGACVATASVFLPAFVNILTWFRIAEKHFAGAKWAQGFVTWAIGAVTGSIAVVLGKLLIAPLEGGSQGVFWAIIVLALGASLSSKLPPWLIIPAGGALAAFLH